MRRNAITAVLLLVITAAVSMAAQQPPLSRAQILALLAGEVPSSRVAMLVQERGIDFASNDTFLDQVRKGGGEDDLVAALQTAHGANGTSAPTGTATSKPLTNNVPTSNTTTTAGTGASKPPVGPPANTSMDEQKQDELAQRTARGAELLQSHHDAEAETEYRAAVKLDPDNSYLHLALARTLNGQKKHDEALKEARLAVKLSPDSDSAHFVLGNTLRLQENYPAAAAEYRETVKLNPKYDMAYNNLGFMLYQQGNVDGAIADYRQALGVNPRNLAAETNLANALEKKGDLNGALEQFRAIVRQRPRLAGPHFRLAQLLEKSGQPRRAVMQYREAHELAPQNAQYREAWEKASRNQKDNN